MLSGTERGVWRNTENLRNSFVDEGFVSEGTRRSWFFAVGQELERTNAVASDHGEQTIGVGTLCVDAFGDPAADGVAVRKEVVEYGDHPCTDVAILSERQR